MQITLIFHDLRLLWKSLLFDFRIFSKCDHSQHILMFWILHWNLFTRRQKMRRKISTLLIWFLLISGKHSFFFWFAEQVCYTYVDLLTWRRRQWNRKQSIRYLAIPLKLFLRKYFSPRRQKKNEQKQFRRRKKEETECVAHLRYVFLSFLISNVEKNFD